MAQKKQVRPKGSKNTLSFGNFVEKLGFFRHSGRNVIGIQIVSDVLRILEIDRGVHPPRIVNFSAIDPLMDNVAEAGDQILGVMHEKRITGRVVHAVVVDPGAELRQVTLPVLGRNEMQALVRRELKKIVPDASPKDLAFDYWYEKAAKKGRKTDVLIGLVPRESSQKIISLMEHIELDTQLITTVPLALIAALETMGEKYLSKITAMIHLERGRSFLVISNRGNWVFSREFQSVLNKEVHEDTGKGQLDVQRRFVSARYMADQERLLIEVNRSLLYFKQRFRGEGVSLAVLSGEAYNLDDIAESFGKSLGVEAGVYSPGEYFHLGHLGERADKLRRIFPSLILPLGAALKTVREAKINFVPQAYIDRRKTRIRRLAVIAASVLLLAVMSLVYMMLHNTRMDLQRTLQENNEQKALAELNKRLDDIAEISAQRDLAKVRSEFLARFTARKSPEENLLIALSHLTPNEVLLYNLIVDRQKGDSTEIDGEIRGTGIADSDRTFNEFYNRLKNSGLFSEVSEPVFSTRFDNGVYFIAFKIDCKLKV
ncbi:MAG TPA: hypothetical protein VM123_06510 [archaeon]|nr:hypothetical protein [archaeon]